MSKAIAVPSLNEEELGEVIKLHMADIERCASEIVTKSNYCFKKELIKEYRELVEEMVKHLDRIERFVL